MRNLGNITDEKRTAHFKGWKNASKLINGLSSIARNQVEKAAISTVLSMGDEIIQAEKNNLKAAATDALITHESAKRVRDQKAELQNRLSRSTKKEDAEKVKALAAEIKEQEKIITSTEKLHKEALAAASEV